MWCWWIFPGIDQTGGQVAVPMAGKSIAIFSFLALSFIAKSPKRSLTPITPEMSASVRRYESARSSIDDNSPMRIPSLNAAKLFEF
jgi:hypothetical protein